MEEFLKRLRETECYQDVEGAAMQVELTEVFTQTQEEPDAPELGPVDIFFLSDGNALVYSRDMGLVAYLEGVYYDESQDTQEEEK